MKDGTIPMFLVESAAFSKNIAYTFRAIFSSWTGFPSSSVWTFSGEKLTESGVPIIDFPRGFAEGPRGNIP